MNNKEKYIYDLISCLKVKPYSITDTIAKKSVYIYDNNIILYDISSKKKSIEYLYRAGNNSKIDTIINRWNKYYVNS